MATVPAAMIDKANLVGGHTMANNAADEHVGNTFVGGWGSLWAICSADASEQAQYATVE